MPASGALEEDQPPVLAGEGPPGETNEHGNSRAPRRWMMSFRAAVLAVCLLVGITAGLAVFKGSGADPDVSSVELTADDRNGGDPVAGSGAATEEDEESGGFITAGASDDGTPRTEPTRAAEQAEAEALGNTPTVLVIHVAGAVGRPGVVRVPSGSRTSDAVDAAGGTAADADLTAVNLAAPLQDGMMVIVPRIGEGTGTSGLVATPQAAAGTGGGGSGAGSAGSVPGLGSLVNINSASLQELDALPKVGPVIAQRIIDWRADHGMFSRPEDLDAVPGIGEAMLAALLPLITV